MRIIVVDDETAPLHLFLEGTLALDHATDYHFFHDDTEKILKYCRDFPVDGAFLDVRMPRVDGVDLARQIIAIHPQIRIVFVTGFNITLEDIDEAVRSNVIGIAFKPLNEMDLSRYLDAMKQQKTILVARTFGSFDCFIHGQLVRFSSTKSKELFAYLIVNDGKSVTMNQAITALWPDREIDKAKILYRDAVWRLRSTLSDIGFPCVEFGRAVLTLNKADIQCDYYDLLAGKDVDYPGEFLASYEWSLPYEEIIDRKLGR